MIVATILLDKDNNYVMEDGKLPERPEFDKALLSGLLRNQTISILGYLLLPPSIQETVTVAGLVHEKFPVTISEIAEADLLIVSRSQSTGKGKKFRLDEFTNLVTDTKIEIWRRK